MILIPADKGDDKSDPLVTIETLAGNIETIIKIVNPFYKTDL
jgi:hypothetical protein